MNGAAVFPYIVGLVTTLSFLLNSSSLWLYRRSTFVLRALELLIYYCNYTAIELVGLKAVEVRGKILFYLGELI